MTLSRRRGLALVTEALCTIYRATGRELWSHHVMMMQFLVFRMERSRDRRREFAGWLVLGGVIEDEAERFPWGEPWEPSLC